MFYWSYGWQYIKYILYSGAFNPGHIRISWGAFKILYVWPHWKLIESESVWLSLDIASLKATQLTFISKRHRESMNSWSIVFLGFAWLSCLLMLPITSACPAFREHALPSHLAICNNLSLLHCQGCKVIIHIHSVISSASGPEETQSWCPCQW